MKVSHCPEDLWKQYCEEDKCCTFFQTPEWHQTAAKYTHAKIIPILFSWNEHQCVLPLLKSHRFLFTYYFSPFGTYSDLITPKPLLDYQIKEISSFLKNKNVLLFSSPFSTNHLPLARPVSNSTYVVKLKLLDPNKVFKNWRKGHKDNLRMGIKKGVKVRLANSVKDLKCYYELYQDTVKHWGSTARTNYDFSLFEDIWNQLIPSGKAKLWLAEAENQILYGVIVFYHQNHAVAWNSASSHAHLRYYASQVIYHDIIAHALKHNFDIFDFNPSGGLEGVTKFKLGFGTEELPFINYFSSSPLFRLWQKIRG
ncbi:MAG: peptidoglycan bridge formation glycyltransferase FemA/FemB family protein [Fibrobacteria bacterium]|nr:peptidoglycan bridge formation glycyltransferase FemA/FemB family protein [Fibrobacteria bacterium]